MLAEVCRNEHLLISSIELKSRKDLAERILIENEMKMENHGNTKAPCVASICLG